jgi:M3 family oligoendopeptidase
MTTTAPLRFADVTAPAPDLDELARETASIRAVLDAARDPQECLPVIARWDALRRGFATWSALVELRFDQDTRDPDAQAARSRRDEIAPRWTELQVEVMRTLLDHAVRPDLEAELGRQAFALWESQVLAFAPEIQDDLVAESKLEAEYTGLLASAELAFRGEEHSLATIVKYRQHADRAVRHGAERVLWSWAEEHGDALDRIFDDLVRVRTAIARKLGFASFVDVGYKRMCRVDYGRADVERLRAEVREHVVPLAAELCRRQAATLGIERLMAWDEHVQDPRGNPAPRGDHDWMLARAQEMFDAMGGELGGFFARMNDGDFLDLKSRKGKAGGGFCTSFPTHGMPFVFANFNGTKGDVEVFTHEMGHAFQCWSSRGQELSDYLWPTMESCEIHSMSLEFLTWPHMERFFGDDAERFRRVHLIESLLFLPYGCAVDHFQHEVYARPDMTPAERHATWREIEHTYLPWRDWGDLAHPAQGGRWQYQRHVYASPFYYVDYVLAQTCALQFWVRAEEDRDAAMEAYVALCRRGGEAPFQALARSAGLTSPFEPGCLAGVVEHARAALGV